MVYPRVRKRRRVKAVNPVPRPEATGPVERPVLPDNPYLSLALRWWWLILLTTVLGGALAVAYLKLGLAPYESTAVVLVPPQVNPAEDTLGNPSEVRSAASNFAAQAASPQVVELVSRALPARYRLSSTELMLMVQQRKVEVRAPTGSNLITIRVTDSDPAFARTLADTYASVFVEDVNRSTTLAIEQRRRELEARITAARNELATAQRYQLLQDLNNRLQSLRQQLLELQATYQTEVQRQIQLSQLGGLNTNPQLAAASAGVQTKWLQLMTDQQRQLEAEIASVTDQINAIQKAIDADPSSVDPTVASALATAYSQQLLKLSQTYADLQLNARAGTLPLSKYGSASEPIPAVGLRLVLLVGLGGGFAAGVAIAYGIDTARRYGLVELNSQTVAGIPARAWRAVTGGARLALGVVLWVPRLFIRGLVGLAHLLGRGFRLVLIPFGVGGRLVLAVARWGGRRVPFLRKRAAVKRRLAGVGSERELRFPVETKPWASNG